MNKNKTKTVWLVSRHVGAMEWLKQQHFEVTHQVQHMDVESIQPGDIVIGILPMHIAAKVCQRGGHYFHISMDVPLELRGQELSVSQMQALGASLDEYKVIKL